MLRYVMIVARFFFGLLTLVAVGAQLSIHLSHSFPVLNFFSYFTNLSNIFAALVFLIGAVYLLLRREPTVTEELVRGASVVAMVIVGIVFSVLLRDTDLGTLAPWVNFIVHYLMPVVVLADWLVLPPRNKLSYQQGVNWLIYPLLYLIYTLIRGAIVGFYPYPFLNPNPGAGQAGNYGVVTLYCIAIFVAFLVIGSLLILIGNRLPRRLAA